MGDRTAFFYGPQMAREVLNRVCFGTSQIANKPHLIEKAAKLVIHDAILYDHCRHKVAYTDYPGMVPEKGASVRGTYVTGLTDDNIRNLDFFEGGEYLKADVKPLLLKEDGNGGLREAEQVNAETYIYIAGADRLEKEEWDYAHFRKEKLQNWADHSDEYAEVDAYVHGEHDPTGGRGVKSNSMAKLQEVDGEKLDEKLKNTD